MKHRGSISQSYISRQEAIIRLYHEAKQKVSWPTTVGRLCEYIANAPVSEHYISDDAALAYVRKRFLHGIHPRFNSAYKQRLYDRFYEIFLEMRKEPEYERMPFGDVARLALMRPANCVGLTPNAIECILHNHFGRNL